MPPHIRQSNEEYYQKAAEAVFAKNPERKYSEDPEFYARSVEEKLWELRQQYRKFNLELGPVGSGMPPEEIKEGTELHDLVARLSVDFPHWKKLHTIWRTEPNVNPYAPSVELPTMEKPSSESETEIDMLVANYMQLESKRWEAKTAEHQNPTREI